MGYHAEAIAKHRFDLDIPARFSSVSRGEHAKEAIAAGLMEDSEVRAVSMAIGSGEPDGSFNDSVRSEDDPMAC